MPIYRVNGDTYDIPENESKGFESAYPNATVEFRVNGDTYDIPLGERSGFMRAYPDAQLSSAQTTPSVEKNFFGGVVEGAKRMYEGSKYQVGAFMDLDAANAQNYKDALAYLDAKGENFDAATFDAEAEVKSNQMARFNKRVDDWRQVMKQRKKERENMSFWDKLKHVADDPDAPDANDSNMGESMAERVAADKPVYMLQRALERSGGDVEKAREYLTVQSQMSETTGQRMMREAGDELANAPELEGAAWWGALVPQLAGQGAALAVGAVNPVLGGVLGAASTTGLTLSSAGSAMAEAKRSGATDKEAWAAAGAQAAIEAGSEAIPFGRLMNRVGGAVMKEGVQKALSEASESELDKILKIGKEKIGGKFLSYNTFKDFAQDIGFEAASEAVAGALETFIPVIYDGSEGLPTFEAVLENAWEGAKPGAVMGGFLGGAASHLRNRAHENRRKHNNGVVLSYYNNGKRHELVEVVYNQDGVATVLRQNGETEQVDRNKLSNTAFYTYDEWKNGTTNYDRAKLSSSYSEGEQIAESNGDVRSLGEDYHYKYNQLSQLYGEEFAKQIYDDPSSILRMEDGDQKAAALDFAQSAARTQGVVDKTREQASNRILEAHKVIDSHVSQADGMIHTAVVANGERQVYVVNGELVADEHGNIDANASTGSVAVVDAETGELEMLSPDAFLNVLPAVNPKDEKATIENAILDEVNAKLSLDIDGRLPFAVGEHHAIPVNGEEVDVMVVDTQDDTVGVTTDGSDYIRLNKSDIENYEWTKRMEAYEARLNSQQSSGGAEQPVRNPQTEVRNPQTEVRKSQTKKRQQAKPSVVESMNGGVGRKVTFTDKDGNEHTGIQVSLATEDGVEVEVDGRVMFVDESALRTPSAEKSSTDEVQQMDGVVGADVPTTALSRVPKNKKGEPMYEQAEPADAWGALLEQADEDAELAHRVAKSMLDKKKAALEEAEKAIAEDGNDVSEVFAAEKVRKAAIAKAKAEVSAWEAIVNQRVTNNSDSEGQNSEAVDETEKDGALGSAERAEDVVGETARTAEDEIDLTEGHEDDGIPVQDGGADEQEDVPGMQENGENDNLLQNNQEIEDISGGENLPLIEGISNDEVVTNVRADIERVLSDSGIDSVEVVEVWPHGSRKRGDAKEGSDLDVVLFYNGDYKEDALFNAISEEGLELNGVKVDVNPIRIQSQKDIERYKQKSAQYDAEVATASQPTGQDGGETATDVAEGAAADVVGETAADVVGETAADVVGETAEEVADGTADGAATDIADETADEIAGDVNVPTQEVEDLGNGESRITSRNSRGEITNISVERDGKIVSVDSYQDGALFEHTEYDADGRATDVTRYNKDGEVVGVQHYKDGAIGKSDLQDYKARKDALAFFGATNGAVNMRTMRPVMTDSEFDALVKDGSRDDVNAYLGEIEDALRVGEGAPLDGANAVRAEYRAAVEQYGKDNIPADVMNGLETRMQSFEDLKRALFDRKYALEDRLRALESQAQSAQDAQAKAEKAAQTQTAFGGFLAGKTALGASSAEKALNKKYKFDGEAMSVAEFVERHANDDTLALSTSEVNKYKGASRSAWNRMSEAEQKADEERVKNSGTKTVYMVNGYDLGKTAYEYAQHLIEKGERRKQEGEKSLAGVVEGKIYKNNLAGGNAVAVVRGKSDGKVLVAYASDVEDAQNGLFMGEQVVSDSDMAQMLERGELAELKQETAGQSVNERIAQAEGETNVAPTDGQKEVGNYKKGHVRVAGYDISIEQPKGSVRSGVDANGNKWEQTMHNTYGYFRGTEGVDGDHIDVFLANDMDAWNGEQVFVVDQYNEDGTFDEHKVMLGFDSIEDAQSAYLNNYEDGWADKHRIVVTGTNAADFKKWVDSSHRKTKAFADYKNVKKNEGQSGTDNNGRDGVAANGTKESGASLRSNLADFKEGDVVRDYYDKQLYRIKKHSKNGVSTIAMLDEDGNEVGTKQMNAHNNSRYSLAEPPVKAEAPTISQESEQVGDKDGSDGVAADGTKEGGALDVEPRRGAFGTIYTQFKGKAKEAIAFLLNKKEGEAVAALHHPEIGDIDLVWGKEGTGKSDGFGLAKLAKFHPEVLDNLQEIINDMHVTGRSVNRVQLESETHQAAVRLTWDNENKNWLLTAFEKKNSVSDNTTDTGETSERGKRNDTATPQNTVSGNKVTGKSSDGQKVEGKNAGRKQEKSKKSGRGSRMLGDYYDQEFEDGLGNGHDVVREEPKTKGTIFDFVTKDKTRPAMQGVHHDGGYAIATDGFVMVGRKDKYDAALDGKTINKKGEPITYEANGEVKDVPYPNWKIAVPQTTEPTGIDIDDLASVIEGIRIADGVKQDSQLIYPISIKTADGKIISMPQGHLRRFLRGAKQVGATEVRVFISNHGSAILMAEGEKGFALAMGSKGVSDTSNSFYDAYTKDASSTAGSTDYNIADEALMAERGSEAFERATEHTIDALKAAGVEVVEATDEMVEEVLGLAEMHKQKKAPETESVLEEEHQPSVVSSADGAKVLKDLDSLIKDYDENANKRPNTFLGDIAQVLGATKHGSNSQYATFEAMNGKVFTIRLANHNAKVSNFDNHGENEGISIVVTAQDNNGINNDGNAHVVEFFYDAIKLRKADGKQLVEILKSIKQALYSGEYKDTTGLAQAEEVNIPEFMQVYHGSGAKFDKFDHSYMGSGEGAQAFGWGTYVTEVEGIGRAYANVAQKNILADEIVNNSYHIHLMEQNIERGMREIAENEAITSFENPSEKAKNKARIAQRKEYISYAQAEISKLKKRNEFLEKNLGDIIGNRVVYTIEIPNNDGANYLNWERGERNDGAVERIAEGLQKEGFELNPNANHTTLERDGKRVVLNAHASGADLYAELSEGLGSDKAASEFLNRIGYVGIKYPTESLSGGNKDGKSNYVIFNEADAQITDRVEFLRTADGVVYGWAVGGKVYLTKEGMNPNTPAHEYTHLWAQMVEKADPKLWGMIVDGLRGCATWNDVLNDKAYEGIWGDDSRMASEVLSRLTGAENYRREMARAQAEIADAKGVFGKAEKVSVWENVKNALRLFLDKVKKLMRFKSEASETTDAPAWMEFVDMTLGDLYGGVNPGKSGGKAELMFIGEKGAAAMDKAEEATTRLDNLAVAREMEAQGKDALAIKMATGWERGADGKWRYEVMDVKDFSMDGYLAHPEYLQKERRYDELMKLFVSMNFENIPSELEQEDISLSRDLRDNKPARGTKLSDFVNMPEVFAAYPDIKDIKIVFDDQTVANGYYNHEDNTIGINRFLDEREVPSLLVHEVQHAIQDREGFAVGGNRNMDNPLSVKRRDEEVAEINRLISDARAEGKGYYDELHALEDGEDDWYAQHPDATAEEDDAHREEVNRRITELREKIGVVDNRLVELYERRNEVEEGDVKFGYEGYLKIAGETEARNSQARMGKSMDERRASLASETADVAQEDQIFIYEGLESAMGSRVDKRMADVAQHFADAELSERQRAIVDVFGGMRNNLPIRIERADGSTRRVVMRQGREDRGGTKHALLRHYGTSSGNYTADELLLIEDVLSVEPTHEQRRGVTVNVYQREIDGVRYTVVTEQNSGREVFSDFYTNRSGNTRSSNTQLSAPADSTTAFSGRKVTENSVAEQNNGQKNVGSMDAATASQRTGQDDDGETLFSYKPFGGNSGYVGYSMSKRAAQAREEGRFPKTDFKKEYGVTERVLDALVESGVVDNAEWHHTSMYGNRTPFYGWVDDAYAEIYAANKEAVKNIAMGKDASGKTLAAKPAENPYTEMAVRIPEGWYPFVNSLDDSLTEDERDAALMERFGDAYAQMKVASENNRLYHEFEANKGRMERAQREEIGERLRAFFEDRAATGLGGEVATASQLTGQDGETATGLRDERGELRGERGEMGGERGADAVQRMGEGVPSDDAVSDANDLIGKALGKRRYGAKQRVAYAERVRRSMVRVAGRLAKDLHLDNVDIVTDVNELPEGKKRGAKGFYSKSTGRITIVVPNHVSTYDIEQTVLHEAVAHYGLRKLFGAHFDTFLDNVFENAEGDVRRSILELAKKNGWDFRTATEEYLASLAEDTDFENAASSVHGWWVKLKSFFMDMLAKAGVKLDIQLTDNELRYILWRSYQNLAHPGTYKGIADVAADVSMQSNLKVGNYRASMTDLDGVAEQMKEQDELFRDETPRERADARERYERRLKTGWFQTQEALQDSMLGLKEAMQSIVGEDVNIEDIAGFENAYLGENRLSSVNKAEIDLLTRRKFKPLYAYVKEIAPTEEERMELEDYMMAKHGLERNALMRERAIEDGDESADTRDFAGLTALTGKEDVAEAEAEAARMVAAFEAGHPSIDRFWQMWGDITQTLLKKSLDSSIISRDTFDEVSAMYEYYVPLRGFSEETSVDAYAYLGAKDNGFNPVMKKAEGRRSKADNPFAYLESMAESTIMQGNRNALVKQKMLNFVMNHPSDLFSVSELWLEYDDVADEWKPVFPVLREYDTAADVQRKVAAFEAKMDALSESHPDRYKKGKDAANIPYRVVDKASLSEHQVIVKRNGKDYVITVNGNPRAAQALNGMTNPDNHSKGAIDKILRTGETLNRHLSSFYTTRNPDFVVSNFFRDMFYTNTMVWLKEGKNYAQAFHKNVLRCNPGEMLRLYHAYHNDTLDMNDELSAMFYQFMVNGGETGYTSIRDIESHKKKIAKMYKDGVLSNVEALFDKLDTLNQSVENAARFAAFVTSRQMGRSIDRSIYDAKEISVNFNKKGSGDKFLGETGQTWIGNAAAMTGALGRSGFVFWNAAIQGSTNFGRAAKRHPKKAIAAAATMFALGVAVAMLGLDDDEGDENAYYNLPEYVRRSHMMFRVGDGYVSIPLPIEYRALYGMGELAVSYMSGKQRMTGSELGMAIAQQASQVLPLDVLEGGGGLNAFVPSALKPISEAYLMNKSWTGLPIYKDSPYNKHAPEYTKVYKSANRQLVGLVEWLNSLSGGDAYTPGAVDINPAQLEYALKGYFGGFASTLDKMIKMGETLIGEREYDPRSFLLWNRLVKAGDERTAQRSYSDRYFKLKEEADKTEYRFRNYLKDSRMGVFDYAQQIHELRESEEFGHYLIMEPYSKAIMELNSQFKIAEKLGNEDAVREIGMIIDSLKREAVEKVDAYDKGRK